MASLVPSIENDKQDQADEINELRGIALYSVYPRGCYPYLFAKYLRERLEKEANAKRAVDSE